MCLTAGLSAICTPRHFVVLHRGVSAIFRGLIYGSFKKPRELVWVCSALIFLALTAEAFQMSFGGTQVIINLFGAIPVIGPDLSTWIRGDFNVSDVTLNRFLCPARDGRAAGAGRFGDGAFDCAARSGLQQPRRRGNQV